MSWLEPLRKGAEEFVDSLGEGWDWLRQRSAAALTRFRRGADDEASGFPDRARGDRWGLLASGLAETDDEVIVRIEVPGLEPGDFAITVDGRQLVVRGEKRFEREEEEAQYHLFEAAYGVFERRFRLPCDVDSEHAKAKYRNGVLTLRLPRAEHVRPRRIRVRPS